jgi:hypothetical protein
MLDYLRIHVLWEDGSEEGARLAELISSHFDGIGMEREGVAHRVPVRFASAPWEPGSRVPAPVAFGRAVHNAVVVLHDDFMHEARSDWDEYVAATRAAMSARGSADAYIPFGSPTGEPVLASDARLNTQYADRRKWRSLPNDAARDKRLLLHLLFQIRRHLRLVAGNDDEEPLFVSHAKADGDGTTRAIVDFVQSTGHDVPLHTFYDAMELNPGEDFRDRFEKEIGRGTLIAIVSDVYDSRPWCVFELTTAKRHRRPIVLADVGGVRISRTFPYGANLPRVRIRPETGSEEWIEPLLVEALSEGLRCDLFQAQAALALTARGTALGGAADVLVLPRPPELFDVVDAAAAPEVIVYPDPPLGDIEANLLRRALNSLRPGTRLVTMGELLT